MTTNKSNKMNGFEYINIYMVQYLHICIILSIIKHLPYIYRTWALYCPINVYI